MMSSNNYPEYIMCVLRQRNDLEEDDHTHDAAFQHMSPQEVWRHMLEWEGICGYSEDLLGWIRDIFGVDLLYADD